MRWIRVVFWLLVVAFVLLSFTKSVELISVDMRKLVPSLAPALVLFYLAWAIGRVVLMRSTEASLEEAEAQFNVQVAQDYRGDITVKDKITAGIFVLLLCFSLAFARETWYFVAFFGFAAVVSILFVGMGKRYRILITEGALIMLFRKTEVIRWSDVRKVEQKYEEYFFTNKYDQVDVLPLKALPSESKKAFYRLLIEKAEKHGFMIDNTVQAL